MDLLVEMTFDRPANRHTPIAVDQVDGDAVLACLRRERGGIKFRHVQAILRQLLTESTGAPDTMQVGFAIRPTVLVHR